MRHLALFVGLSVVSAFLAPQAMAADDILVVKTNLTGFDSKANQALGANEIYAVDSTTGTATLIKSFPLFQTGSLAGIGVTEVTMDHASGLLYMRNILGKVAVYDRANNEVREATLPVSGVITAAGIVGGTNSLISEGEGGSVHIGENSLVTVEENGRQSLYATDGAGKAIDVDINNGSDLRVNGKSVMDAINGGTALSLASGGLRFDDRPGKLSIAGGFGHYNNMSGLALGLGYTAPSEDMRFSASLAHSPGNKDTGVSVSVGFTLN